MAESIEFRSTYIRNFAMHVSHEFKTPLTSIQGSIELLQSYLDEMPIEKRERFFSNILQDTIRLKQLVNRLLELAKADVFEPTSETTDIIKVLHELAERYKDYNVVVTIKSDFTVLEAAISKEVLDIILTNLFDNSNQHGAGCVEVEVVKNKNIEIHITDDGDGISQANAKQIFTPFFTTNRKKGGTGLGLSIVNSLLQAHHGNITLLSSKTGTSFLIDLPNNQTLS